MTTIKSYLEANRNRWSTTTYRSEASRLQANRELIEMGPTDFNAVYEQAKLKLKPYSLKTTLIRLADFWAFHGEHAPKRWLKENANVFKGAYVRRPAELTLAEAKRLLASIGDERYHALATEILHSGLRASESLVRDGDYVVGKGGATRRVFGRALLSSGERSQLSYSQLWRTLRAVGLKPHTLRKIFATELARSGRVGEADLLAAMGWTSMQTATSYLAPLRADKLKAIIEGVTSDDDRRD
jgi:integrase